MFRLNLEETFERLTQPPVVEAVLYWQTRPTQELDPQKTRLHFGKHLPRFQSLTLMPETQLSPMYPAINETANPQKSRRHGFQLISADRGEIVVVSRDGLSYSVVKSYPHWQAFSLAAKEVWSSFVELAEPEDIQRLGVRFINHLPGVTSQTLPVVLKSPPVNPDILSLREFVNQSSFDVPNFEYGVRIIQVLQTASGSSTQGCGLFLDINCYTTRSITCDINEIDEKLKELRWLKNKVFFSQLSQEAIQSFV